MGTDSIRIISDLTVDQHPQRPGESFYERLGASPVLFIEESGSREEAKYTGSEDLVAPTTLTDKQVEHLKEVFTK